MEVTKFIQRICREGICTSTKEPFEISQAVILQGLRYLQLADAERILRAATERTERRDV